LTQTIGVSPRRSTNADASREVRLEARVEQQATIASSGEAFASRSRAREAAVLDPDVHNVELVNHNGG
jgi:hypothetical protein